MVSSIGILTPVKSNKGDTIENIVVYYGLHFLIVTNKFSLHFYFVT